MAAKLTVPEVRALFKQYDALLDIKSARSSLLEQIFKGFGPGPYEQDGARFKIVKRKINGTEDHRFILRDLDSEGDPTKI